MMDGTDVWIVMIALVSHMQQRIPVLRVSSTQVALAVGGTLNWK